MSVTSQAHVSTVLGRRYLAEACRRLEERALANPELGLTVERTEADATIDFGWSRCTLDVDDTRLVLRATAEDDEALAQVCELIARHLEVGAEEAFALTWSHQQGPDTDADRRDHMRSFHARMHGA